LRRRYVTLLDAKRLTSGISDPDLRVIVSKCVAINAEDRYSDSGRLASDLQRWLDGYPVPNSGRRYTFWEKVRLLRRRARVSIPQFHPEMNVIWSFFMCLLTLGVLINTLIFGTLIGFVLDESQIRVTRNLGSMVLIFMLLASMFGFWRLVRTPEALDYVQFMLSYMVLFLVIRFGIGLPEKYSNSAILIAIVSLTSVCLGLKRPEWLATRVVGWVFLALAWPISLMLTWAESFALGLVFTTLVYIALFMSFATAYLRPSRLAKILDGYNPNTLKNSLQTADSGPSQQLTSPLVDAVTLAVDRK
jgi:hypothetical protein